MQIAYSACPAGGRKPSRTLGYGLYRAGIYGRIWDADVADALSEAIEGSSWHAPLAYGGEPAGLYASDRDMFVFLVSDENPVEIANARLGRGFFCWNSETGAPTFGLTTFLYNYVCGNHIVWEAEQVQELRIIHRNQALKRFYSDAIPVMNRFIENRGLDDAIKDRSPRRWEDESANLWTKSLSECSLSNSPKAKLIKPGHTV